MTDNSLFYPSPPSTLCHLLGVPGSGREGAGMGEVAGCMDLEEAGLSRSLPHIPAAGARGALRWAGSVPGGAVAGETQHPLLSRWALEGPVQPLTQGEAHSGAGRGSQGSRTHVGEPAWKPKCVPRGVWEPTWGSIRCPTVTE